MKTHINTAISAIAATAGVANASILDFYVDWSGASLGNGVTATGTVSFDDTLLDNPGDNSTEDTPFVTAFSITITGSILGLGDGTWTLADFDEIMFQTGGLPLDLTQELVGQPTDVDPWGTPLSAGGDFNVFPRTGGAPVGSYYFTLALPATSEELLITSFRPAPAPGALGVLACAGIVSARRRR